MHVESLLACSLGRRDEEPNIELARRIAVDSDQLAMQQLQQLIHHKKKAIRYDAIKVVYEIGEMKPVLISPLFPEFLKLIAGKDNRMQWGAMTAINTLARLDESLIALHLPDLLRAEPKGSVITRDQLVNILVQLGLQAEYRQLVLDPLFDILQRAPANQFPAYCEDIAQLEGKDVIPRLIEAIDLRKPNIHKASSRKRLDKLMRKLK